MYSEQKLIRVNKIIKDMVFESNTEYLEGLFANFEYQFQITGVKKMISVGELYDYLVVDVTIVGGDRSFDILSKLMGHLVVKEYRLLVRLNNSISDELVYFFDGSHPRIHIPDGSVKFSNEYKNKLDEMDLSRSFE